MESNRKIVLTQDGDCGRIEVTGPYSQHDLLRDVAFLIYELLNSMAEKEKEVAAKDETGTKILEDIETLMKGSSELVPFSVIYNDFLASIMAAIISKNKDKNLLTLYSTVLQFLKGTTLCLIDRGTISKQSAFVNILDVAASIMDESK